MKRSYLLTLSLIILFVLPAGIMFADEQTSYFQSVVIESFDQTSEQQWYVRGSKFIHEDYPVFKLLPVYPDAAFRKAENTDDLRSLGIQFMFDRKGYNYLEIFPVTGEQDENGNPIPDPIKLPGRIANLDCWVWGANYSYYLEVHIMDNDGRIHVLKLGDIDYLGWKNLRVDIPNYIDQSIRYAPQRRGLELVKLVLWTRPDEKVADYYEGKVQPIYFYLDQIKIFSDQFESPYDGSDLASDADYINDLWSEGE